MKRIGAIALAAWFCFGAHGAEKFFALDAGAYVDNLAQRLSAPDGYTGDVSTLSGFFRARRGFPLSARWTFEPSLGALFPWRSGRDGFAKTFTFQLDLPLGFDLLRFLKVRGGPGMSYLLIGTQGEAINLNNGNGFSTFYLPGGLSHVFLFTLSLGFEIKLFRLVSLNLDGWVSDVASRARRRFQLAATLGFRW